DAVELHAAGDFEEDVRGLLADELDALLDAGGVEVVEEDYVRLLFESVGEHREGRHFDLDLEERRRGGFRPADRFAHAAGGVDVVVLDEDPVEETDAMVLRAAATNRELLQRAPAGRRLAGVEDLRLVRLRRFREGAG